MFHLSLHKIHKYKMPDNAKKRPKMVANYTPRTRSHCSGKRQRSRPRNRNGKRTQSRPSKRMTAMKIATGIFPAVSQCCCCCCWRCRQARCGKSHFWITKHATFRRVGEWVRASGTESACKASGAEKHCGWWESTVLSVNFATRSECCHNSPRCATTRSVTVRLASCALARSFALSLSALTHTKWRTSIERTSQCAIVEVRATA